MIRFLWGRTFPTPPLFSTNGKGDGKQTTQPLIPKQAPASARSLAPYPGCSGFSGLEKTRGAKFSHDLHLARQVREGPAQHWQLCPEFWDTRESLRAAGWESWTFGSSSSAGNAQRIADPTREPQPGSTPPATLRVGFGSSLRSFSRETVLLVWKTTLSFNHNQVHKYKYRLCHRFCTHGVKFPTLGTQMLRTGCLIMSVTANQCSCQSVQPAA